MNRTAEPRYTIRPAAVDDTVEIRRMHAESWLATYPSPENGVTYQWVKDYTDTWLTPEALRESEGYVQRAIEDKAGFYRLAEQDSRIVGFVHAVTNDDGSKELKAIYTHPDTFGTGLAQMLMDQAIDWIGDTTTTLNVASYNTRAIKFYGKYGFVALPGMGEKYRDKIPTINMRREVKYG